MNKFWLVALLFLVLSVLGSCLSFDSNPYKQGKNLYIQNCQNCHQEDGKALEGLIPPLAGSDYLVKFRSQLPCLVRNGMDTAIVVNGITYDHPMPGNADLTPTQITNVLNYINHAWGNNGEYISYEEVNEALKECGGGD